jgi:hypothetical protein
VSSYVATSNTEAAILARIIESDVTAITPDVARYLLSMQLTKLAPTRSASTSASTSARPRS